MTDNLKDRIVEALRPLATRSSPNASQYVIEQAAQAVLNIVEPMLSKWLPIESADKSRRIIGIWKDGKWQSAELWYDNQVDEWTHTGGDYYVNPRYFMYPPQPEKE